MSKNNHQVPDVQVTDPTEEISKKLDFFIQLVIGALFIGFISLLITVVGIAIDAYRFNSTMYKESQQLSKQQELIQGTVKIQSEIFDKLESIEKAKIK